MPSTPREIRGPFLYADVGSGRGLERIETADTSNGAAFDLVARRRAVRAEIRFDGALIFEAYIVPGSSTLAWRSATMTGPVFGPLERERPASRG